MYFALKNISHFGIATFEMLNSQMWPEVILLKVQTAPFHGKKKSIHGEKFMLTFLKKAKIHILYCNTYLIS